MAVRSLTAWLPAGLLFVAVLSPAAAQSPPRRVQVLPTRTGSVLIGLGTSSDAGLTGSILLPDQPRETAAGAEEQEPLPTIDTVCPCFFDILQRWWQKAARPKIEPEPAGLSCPYLKQQAAAGPPTVDPVPGKPVSVLDNLSKLENAQKLYEQAEYYRRSGHPVAAAYYFRLIQEQCPGSRYDQLAARQLDELRVQKAELLPFPTAEEEEPGARLEPDLPPLDPKLAEALEKILTEVGDPEMPKLIFPPDAPAEPMEEEELDPGLGWVPVVPEEEAPILVVVPEEAPPPADEEADDEEDEEPLVEVVPDWNQVFRDVIDAVAAGSCVEIDGSRLGRLRFLCQHQVGAVTVRIFTDGDGVWSCVVASLDPEAGGDLRAGQRAFNERIGRWIEELNAGPATDQTDDEDDGSDDDPDDDVISSDF